jgi:hypothetical protein
MELQFTNFNFKETQPLNHLTSLKQNNAGTVEHETQWLNWNDIGPSVIHNDYITMQPILFY